MLVLTSCFGDEEETDYTEWRQQNIDYMTKAAGFTTPDGEKEYERLSPLWAPDEYILIKWHNDRSLTADNLVPLDNSLVNIKYEFSNIEGEYWGDSYSNKINGDSIYQSRPCQNIIGMWTALTNMHVGDSVTMIIPASAAYGSAERAPILPYSTLIYSVKLTEIVAFEAKN